MSDINETLKERDKAYGSFTSTAICAQALKAVVDVHHTSHLMASDQIEAMQMICTKMARIITGNPNHTDSWYDIAGYAQLIVDRLNGK